MKSRLTGLTGLLHVMNILEVNMGLSTSFLVISVLSTQYKYFLFL